MNSDGSNKRIVKTGKESIDVYSDCLRFSPDGDSLVFSKKPFGSPYAQSNIYIVETSGKSLEKIIANGRGAAWGKETISR